MKYRDYINWAHFSRLGISSRWKALDVGCGAGDEVAYIRSLGCEAYGLDNASGSYQINHEYCFLADARTIPCKSNCFDLIVCFSAYS